MRLLLISLFLLATFPSSSLAEALVYNKRLVKIHVGNAMPADKDVVATADPSKPLPPAPIPERIVSYDVDMRPPEVLESDLIVGSPFAEGEGILIEFGEEQIVAVPLQTIFSARDLVFANSGGIIKEIIANASGELQQSVESAEAAKYLLQINAGEADANNIKVGDRIEIADKVEIKQEPAKPDADIPADSRTAR